MKNDITLLEPDTFKMNDDAIIKLISLPNTDDNIIIVDDFYKYPDRVRDLALWAPATENYTNAQPGFRAVLKVFDSHVHNFVKEILKTFPNAFGKVKIENEASKKLFTSVGFKEKFIIYEYDNKN